MNKKNAADCKKRNKRIANLIAPKRVVAKSGKVTFHTIHSLKAMKNKKKVVKTTSQ